MVEPFLQLELSGDYRVGTAYKAIFSSGLAVSSRRVSEIGETGLSPEQVSVFRELVLPKVRRDIYPFVRYRLSVPRFVVFTNLGTYGLSENVQIGPQLEGLIAVPLKAYGASSDGLILRGRIGRVETGRRGKHLPVASANRPDGQND